MRECVSERCWEITLRVNSVRSTFTRLGFSFVKSRNLGWGGQFSSTHVYEKLQKMYHVSKHTHTHTHTHEQQAAATAAGDRMKTDKVPLPDGWTQGSLFVSLSLSLPRSISSLLSSFALAVPYSLVPFDSL